MAANRPARDDEAATKGPGIWPLLQRICISLAIASMTVLLVAAYDFGFIDLRYTLSNITAPLIATAVLTATVSLIATARGGEAYRQSIEDTLQEMKVATALRAENVEKKLEEYLGEEYKRLLAESDQMKSQLEEVKKSEFEKLKEENKFLKELNSTLQTKINSRSAPAQTDAEENERLEVLG